MINEQDEMFMKLSKLKKPKAPEGVVDIPNVAFFSIKPRDSIKTYYFGVPSSERTLWVGYLNDAKDGMNRFRESLRLKRGATASLSSSSATLMGNLQPIGGNTVVGHTGAPTPSGSVSSTESGGSYTSLGPASGRSFQSGSSNSIRSNTTNSSSSSGVRLTTIETGTMPGSLAQHSASAPPARQFNIVVSSPLTSLTPRPMPLDEDPFGLVQATAAVEEASTASNHIVAPATQIELSTPTSAAHILSPETDELLGRSPSASSNDYQAGVIPPTSPASPQPGTTVLTAMPQPIIFSNQGSIRDSFVFDSAM